MSEIATKTGAQMRTVWTVLAGGIDSLPPRAAVWAKSVGFKAGAGDVLLVPGEDGAVESAVLGLGGAAEGAMEEGAQALLTGALATALPGGDWRLADAHALNEDLCALGFRLGAYRFARYRTEAETTDRPRLIAARAPVDERAEGVAEAVALARDLINTPANDMGPDRIEEAVRNLGGRFGASVTAIVGDDLIARNFPMIHAVGRASAIAPRIVDLTWGRDQAPKVTLVGKGVTFDTGGLDIKPSSGMLLMKKDMGGAANVLALARLIMASRLDVRLRVLVPTVENAISGSAFRPGDILSSRKGKTVEIGNTDAEGRLILADALALADEEAPDLLIDMATLTGAARVALGPDLAPFFTTDEAFAAELLVASQAVADPVWRLPLWKPYAKNLASKVADINNVTPDGFAGAVTAALFLQGFVEAAGTHVHFDIFGWRPQASAIGPVGGEAQAIRALHRLLTQRYPAAA